MNSKLNNFLGSMRWVMLILLGALAGCSAGPVNPSFPTAPDRADEILDGIAHNPKPLDRPVLIVSGFLDPGLAAVLIHEDLEKYVKDRRIIHCSLGFVTSFDQCRQRIIDTVDASFPNSDPTFTTEVDVIGYSLGGVAARYAAIAPWEGHTPTRRLKIARLFSISAPMRGAESAADAPIEVHPLQVNLEPGSVFLRRLNDDAEKEWAYPVFPYIRLGDDTIGYDNAAPPGQKAWWIATPSMSSPHDAAFSDRRIMADIVLRLRGDKPLTSDPPAPPPAED